MIPFDTDDNGRGGLTYVQYPRFADDLVIPVHCHHSHDWVLKASPMQEIRTLGWRPKEPDMGGALTRLLPTLESGNTADGPGSHGRPAPVFNLDIPIVTAAVAAANRWGARDEGDQTEPIPTDQGIGPRFDCLRDRNEASAQGHGVGVHATTLWHLQRLAITFRKSTA